MLKLTGKMKQLLICPKCGRIYDDVPAISREDNETEICPQCGMKEAIEEFQNRKGENEND